MLPRLHSESIWELPGYKSCTGEKLSLGVTGDSLNATNA